MKRAPLGITDGTGSFLSRGNDSQNGRGFGGTPGMSRSHAVVPGGSSFCDMFAFVSVRPVSHDHHYHSRYRNKSAPTSDATSFACDLPDSVVILSLVVLGNARDVTLVQLRHHCTMTTDLNRQRCVCCRALYQERELPSPILWELASCLIYARALLEYVNSIVWGVLLTRCYRP